LVAGAARECERREREARTVAKSMFVNQLIKELLLIDSNLSLLMIELATFFVEYISLGREAATWLFILCPICIASNYNHFV
jgi:hypothetical protein